MPYLDTVLNVLWNNALTGVPVGLAVAALCRWSPLRPATRHVLWVGVLLWLIAPPIAPPAPSWLSRPGAVVPSKSAEPAPVPSVPPAQPARRVAPTLATPLLAMRAPEIASEPCSASTAIAAVPPLRPGTSRAFVAPRVASAAATPREAVALPRAEQSPRGTDPFRSDRRYETPESPAPTVFPVRPRDFSAPTQPATVAPPNPPLLEWIRSARRSIESALERLPWRGLAATWVGVAALLVIGRAAAALSGRARWGRGVAAPVWVRRMVSDAGRAFGLRRTPETRFVDAPVSPLITCGWRPRLILPLRLWRELDARGRRAVVYHELAHLKRRDHWVRWLQVTVDCLFWWHPLAWVASRRVAEEAETCCDRWVTWLLPCSRRVYAEALIAAGAGVGARPHAGLAMSEFSTRRIARRITMIMTQSHRPGLTLAGACLAATIGFAGWLATPVLADKPTATEQPAPVAVAGAARTTPAPTAPRARPPARSSAFGGQTPAAAVPPTPPTPPMSPALPARAVTPTPPIPPAPPAPAVIAGGSDPIWIVGHGHGSPPDRDSASLERRLEALQQELHRLAEEVRGIQSPRPFTVIRPGQPGMFDAHSHGPPAQLSPGKLDAMWQLMAREDVPVRVSMGDGTIDVHGDEHEQRIVAAFMAMIAPDCEARGYRLPPEKLEALYTLMSRDDVPLYVSQDGEQITIHATPAQHEILGAFLALLEGARTSAAPRPAAAIATTVAPDRAARERALADRNRAAFQAAREAFRTRRDQSRELSQLLRRQASAAAQEAASVERSLEGLARRAEQDARRAATAGGDGAAAEATTAAVEAMTEQLEVQLEALEQRIEELERRAEELDEQTERASDELEAAIESWTERGELAIANLDELPELAELLQGFAEMPDDAEAWIDIDDLDSLAYIDVPADEADAPSPCETTTPKP